MMLVKSPPTTVFATFAIIWVAFAFNANAQVDFARDIVPIFETHCYECHGPEKQKSGYRLDVREIALKGGDNGVAAILPNHSLKSPLFRFVSGEDEESLMPPKDSGKPRLNSDELAKVQEWLDQGAIWPDSLSGQKRLASTHWSLQPIKIPNPTTGVESPVDGFVRTKLLESNLGPTPEADRRKLIRRISFDLIGLPPSPEEIEAFVSDRSPNAYEALVDRLLASPHYGERWGRHWLDIARYTESQGFEYDRIRDNAWHYRDYVIKSFNEDKPYDQFMREQIAGDVLEPVTSDGIVATSLLVCGPWDQAGNGQSNKTQRAITREDELEDMIGVVGQSFLGLTINCARCHAHKFDPIPHEEYYRVKSVFEGVKHGERSIATAEEIMARNQRQKELESAIDAANQMVSRIEAVGAEQALAKRPKGTTELGPIPYAKWTFDGTPIEVMPGELKGGATVRKWDNEGGVLQLPKEGAFFQTAKLTKNIREKTLEAWVSLTSLEQGGGAAISIETGNGRVFDAIVFGEQQPKKWTSGSEGFARTKPFDAPEETASANTFVHVAIAYASDNSITMFRNGEPYGTAYTPKTPLQTFAAGDAHVLLGYRHTGGGRPWLTGEIKQAALYDRALSHAEIAKSYRAGGLSVTRAESLASLSPEQAERHASALADLERNKKLLSEMPKAPVSYAGIRIQPPNTMRLKRGDVNSPDEEVTPGGLSAVFELEPDFGLKADAPEKDRRLKFAEWLSDLRNPLPARVMANRVWHLHFGQGLVGTPNDFGVSGDRPSHPELLDWLAAKLIESGWSVKALHKLIVLSSTYRQGSAFNDPAARVDSDNRLLWRFAPRRLEAEALRDAILVASGQLNPAGGGPSFRPFTTTEFNATFYTPIDSPEPEFNRRTVYRINVNSGKDPMLDSFDCPDPSVKTPRRGVTTTPLQALELMNNSFIQRQAQHLAERAMQSAKNEIGGAIEAAYQMTIGRIPNDEELNRARLVAKERGIVSVCWALFNSTEFIYVQ
jgi:Protein of unknown function (DUF1553)/Protein of unknown function (DUF1549)/Planctomycete cytochrome C/Concanavalin A-like lectin/glucanases superfamily